MILIVEEKHIDLEENTVYDVRNSVRDMTSETSL